MTVAALLCVLRPLLVVQFLLFPSWSLDPNRLQHFVVAATENGTKNSKTETSTASKKSKATTTTSKPKAQNEKFSDKRGKSFFPLENDIDTGAKTVDWNHTDGRTVAAQVAQHLGISLLEDRFAQLFAKATSEECRAKIAHHAASFYHALATEVSLPFAAEQFGAPNECTETVHDWNNLPEGMHIGDIQNRSYQPPRNDNNTVYIEDPSQLKICYVILTHDNANSTIRLIESLYEAKPLHQFVIHVDAKYNQTQTILLDYAQDKEDYIYIVPDHNRVRVNWGGFSMVNATLQAMRYAFALDDDDNNEDNGDVNSNSRRHRRRSALDFHKLVHLSSSSYPLASNLEIRHKLASYPLDANFLHIILNPSRPGNHGWHYFVECDDALHRIYQLTPLRREVSGIDMYTSSQWFIISREFAEYLAKAEEGSMVERFLKYIQHVVVADETFFGTVLRNTKFCHCHHNDNFLHLQFDRWESDLPATQRDSRKCPMPDPDHCGRSPTTMTLDYADIMELSANLFARKV